jgi:metallo-beta-lactamase class B
MECKGQRCLHVVLADSLSTVSSPGFKFSDGQRYPTALADFERSFATIAALPCDILLTVHPEASDLWTRLQQRTSASADELIDKDACRHYADVAKQRLSARIQQEKS